MAEEPEAEASPPHDGRAILTSRLSESDDPTIAVLERISRQLHSIRIMLIFFVVLALLSMVVGGIIWLVAADSARSSSF